VIGFTPSNGFEFIHDGINSLGCTHAQVPCAQQASDARGEVSKIRRTGDENRTLAHRGFGRPTPHSRAAGAQRTCGSSIAEVTLGRRLTVSRVDGEQQHSVGEVD